VESEWFLEHINCAGGYEGNIDMLHECCPFGTGVVTGVKTLVIPIYAYDWWWNRSYVNDETTYRSEKMFKIETLQLLADPSIIPGDELITDLY
jgi:hypothetical protein